MSRLRLNVILSCARSYCQNISKSTSSAGSSLPPKPSSSTPAINTNVAGLSGRCVKSSSEPVGPGASPTADYKVPEYFLYSKATYHEAEVELAKYRCPQPSALKK